MDRLATAAARRRPLRTRFAGAGAFPDVTRAKVLFAAVETDEDGRAELDRPAAGARSAVATAGAEVDGARFHPHLTLARLGRPVEATRWVRVLGSYRGPEWTIAEIVLVASHLGEGARRRPRHEVLETFSLGPAGSAPGHASAPPRGR